MLSQTKEQKQELINKIQVLDFVLNSMATNHADYKEKIEALYKQASFHKLKLVEELLNLSGAKGVKEVIDVEVIKPD